MSSQLGETSNITAKIRREIGTSGIFLESDKLLQCLEKNHEVFLRVEKGISMGLNGLTFAHQRVSNGFNT